MSLTGRFSALFLAALGLVLVGLLDGPVRLGADLPRSPGRRPARRGTGHPGGGGRDPSRRRGVGAAGAVHRAGPGIGGRPVALDGLRRSRARRSTIRANLADSDDLAAELARPDGPVPGPAGRSAGAGPGGSSRRSPPARGRRVSGPTRPRAGGPPPGRGRRGAFTRFLVLIACAPLGPTEATLATLGWLLAALSAGIWLAAAAAVPRALAAGPAAR